MTDQTLPFAAEVQHSIIAPRAIQAVFQQAYDPAPILHCSLIRSWCNEVYRIENASGIYYAKLYRLGWRDASAAAYESELIQHLSQRIPVAAVQARRDGGLISTVAAPEGPRILQVCRGAPGRKPTAITEALYYQVGQALGAMHQAQAGFASPAPRRCLDFTTLLDEPLAIVRPWLAHRPADWEYLCALAERTRSHIQRLDDLALGVCHGDPTLDNLHYTDNGQITYYDFDQCGPGWLAYDLQGVFQYARRLPNPGFWDSFLRGYQTRRSLSAGEVQAMPYFVLLNEYWCMGFEAGTVVHSRGEALINDGYFTTWIERWKNWEAQCLV